MIAQDIVTQERIPLKLSDTGTIALALMDELKVSNLPIVNEHEYIGMISENEILDLNIGDQVLEKHSKNLSRPFVLETDHLYEVIKILANSKLRTLPVLNKDKEYTGSITLLNVVEKLSWLSAAREPGGIIVLEINKIDYSLSEIAQIVESNDGKVLSCHVSSSKDNLKLDVTLKINKEDLSGILQTFSRYSYTIKADFNRNDLKDDTEDKFNALMNYINI